jgi:hypothetical protein
MQKTGVHRAALARLGPGIYVTIGACTICSRSEKKSEFFQRTALRLGDVQALLSEHNDTHGFKVKVRWW